MNGALTREPDAVDTAVGKDVSAGLLSHCIRWIGNAITF